MDDKKKLYDIGEAPPLGVVPEKMHAWLVRAERFGEPTKAWKQEVVDVPDIADDEVLVYVMAAGVNYNNVWSGLGVPVNVIAARNKAGQTEDFHIGGSDASGIVYKVGRDVTNVKVGDEVVTHCGSWSRDCPVVTSGQDPMFSPTFRIWGYETNYGSFAQFTRVQAQQCLPKPKHLTWEDAGAYMLVGATAYRMLMGWEENAIKAGDVVLIWGGAGGLGSMAIQIARAKGAVPVAVVSSDDKFPYVKKLGAVGAINRKDFDHWGMLPHWKDQVGYAKWLKGVRAFGKAIWDVLGEKKNPQMVFEHPGESTIPTSIFVTETGGMVAICAGTTGFNATVDLRYLWMRQKRLQGSHFANGEQAKGLNDLVIDGLVDPCMSQVFTYEQLPDSHQLMYENKHPHGNMAILVGALEVGMGISAEIPRARPVSALPDEIDVVVERDTVRVEPQLTPALDPVGAPEQPAFPDDGVKVRDILHAGVITASPDTTVNGIAKLLVDHHIHAVVIVDPHFGALGVVSQTDVVLARQGRSKEELAALRVSSIMSAGLLTCSLDDSVTSVVTTMTSKRVHRLVVVDEQNGNKIPIGVVSMTDIIRKMIGQAPDYDKCACKDAN